MADDELKLSITADTPETKGTLHTFAQMLAFPKNLATGFAMNLAVYSWAFNQIHQFAKTLFDYLEASWNRQKQSARDWADTMRAMQFGMPGQQADLGTLAQHFPAMRRAGLSEAEMKPFLSTLATKMPGVFPEHIAPAARMHVALGGGAPSAAASAELYHLIAANYPGMERQRTDQLVAAFTAIPGLGQEHAASLAKLTFEAQSMGIPFEDALASYMLFAGAGAPLQRAPTSMIRFWEEAQKKAPQLAAKYGLPGIDPRTGKFTDYRGFMRGFMNLPEEQVAQLAGGAMPEMTRAQARRFVRAATGPGAEARYEEVLALQEPGRAAEIAEGMYQTQGRLYDRVRGGAVGGDIMEAAKGPALLFYAEQLQKGEGKEVPELYRRLLEPSLTRRVGLGLRTTSGMRDRLKEVMGADVAALAKEGTVDPQELAVMMLANVVQYARGGGLAAHPAMRPRTRETLAQYRAGGIGAIRDEDIRRMAEDVPSFLNLFQTESQRREAEEAAGLKAPVQWVGVQNNYAAPTKSGAAETATQSRWVDQWMDFAGTPNDLRW